MPFYNLSIAPVPKDIVEGCIADFVTSEGSWRWNLFGHLIPHNILLMIAAVKPPDAHSGNDHFYWAHSPFGYFMAKSTYQQLSKNDLSHTNPCWKNLWKWKGPQCIKMFLWLSGQGKLKCNAELVKRHSCTDATCPQCDGGIEDALHTLRDCFVVNRIWRELIPSRDYGSATNVNAMVIDVKSRAEEIHRVFDIFDINKGKRVEKYFGWLPLVWVAYKLNTDGACKASSLALVGGLSRDAQGGWIKGFSINIGMCSITKAELWGMYHGLILAWNKGIRLLIVEADS
ncbi:putative ribonuclease H protein [Citrus sinensis]|nr:putative ribonuclease H protein [Citrus sinensis]